MKGFVKNEGERGTFILQRTLPPGATLSFEDAYLSVGKKSGKKKGISFVRWLRDNYLSETQWVFYKEEGIPYFVQKKLKEIEEKPVEPVAPAKGAGTVMRRKPDGTKGTEITPNTIIEEQFDRAKVLIDKCADKNVLKKALVLSQHFSAKEEHMRHLMRRLQQVY